MSTKSCPRSVLREACAPRTGSSGLPERISRTKVRRLEAGAARSCATAPMSTLLGCGLVVGWVCQLPTQATAPRKRRAFSSAASSIPSVPQVKWSSEAALSGGGPSTSVTQRTPAASFNSPKTSPPVSTVGPAVRAERLAHAPISRTASGDTRIEYPLSSSIKVRSGGQENAWTGPCSSKIHPAPVCPLSGFDSARATAFSIRAESPAKSASEPTNVGSEHPCSG